MADLQGKKVAMIIASQNFRDEEYLHPKEVLQSYSAQITTVSSSKNPARGVLDATVQPDILLSELNSSDYDAILFIGGGGAREYFDNPTAHKVAKETLNLGKVLGAICIAPSILANAGLLKGKKATCFSSEVSNLKAKGAIYTGADVETDGNIVTATGPQAAKKFGETVAAKLSNE